MTQITIVIPAGQLVEVRRGVARSLDAVREDLDHLKRKRRDSPRRTERQAQLEALIALAGQLDGGPDADRDVTGEHDQLRTAVCDALMGTLEQLAVIAGCYWRHRAALRRVQAQHAAVTPYLRLLAEIERAARHRPRRERT